MSAASFIPQLPVVIHSSPVAVFRMLLLQFFVLVFLVPFAVGTPVILIITGLSCCCSCHCSSF